MRELIESMSNLSKSSNTFMVSSLDRVLELL